MSDKIKRPFITKGDDPVVSSGTLEWPQVQALLKTMAEDKNIDLKKMEIRRKQAGYYHVIVKAKRKKPNA
jgi:hypothetical protein